MKTKRILLAIVCLLVILGGLNYLLQQSPIPIGTPGSTPAAPWQSRALSTLRQIALVYPLC